MVSDLCVSAAGYHGENDEESKQIRFGSAIRIVCTEYWSRTYRQAIFIRKELGATFHIQSYDEPNKIEYQFEHDCNLNRQQQCQCKKVRKQISDLFDI